MQINIGYIETRHCSFIAFFGNIFNGIPMFLEYWLYMRNTGNEKSWRNIEYIPNISNKIQKLRIF